MVRARLSGINTATKRLADGSVAVYYYHRATNRRLPGEPGSPEFLVAFAEAERSLQERHSGTFIQLVRDFTLSAEFAKLANSTQSEYRRMLTKAEAKFGTMPILALNAPKVAGVFKRWRAEIASASGEREADNRLSAISAMLTWAADNDRIDANHLKGFKRLYASNRAEAVWLPEHINAFWAVAPVELQRAMMLALHTGQRQGDLLRLTWANYDGTAITLRQGKSKRYGRVAPLVVIPCTASLKRMLDEMDRGDRLVILATKTGLPFKKRYFAELWDRTTKQAGIEGLHFHDLRGTAVTMLAEAGATVPEIAAITGHALKSVNTILEKYLPRTRAMADQAIFRFENAARTQFANRLQTGAQNSGNGGTK